MSKLNTNCDYELIIKKVVKEDLKEIKLVSNTSNIVFKVSLMNGENLYAKFYQNKSSHIDNELLLYKIASCKYLKELYYKSSNPKMAIFKELVGKTVDELSLEELEINSDKIINAVCDFFTDVSSKKINGYGILNDELKGKYNNFLEFLKARQETTSNILKEYKNLTGLANYIFEKYSEIMFSDNSLVPIDTNLKNIMLLNDGGIKFVDPGEMISAPVLMGYGDLVAHIYKTPLYEKLIAKLALSKNDEKLLRIYAIFSSLNILAFLKQNGVDDLESVIPFGNRYTFVNLIYEHLEFLDINLKGI